MWCILKVHHVEFSIVLIFFEILKKHSKNYELNNISEVKLSFYRVTIELQIA